MTTPTLPGFYWYSDRIGAPPELVELKHDGEALVVLWDGRDDTDLANDLAGTFRGPVAPPAGRGAP